MKQPLVALLDMYGVDVRLSRYRHTFLLPDWLTSAKAFQDERGRILDRCATGASFDGPTWVPADMSLSRTHAVLECATLPYSESLAISAVYREVGGPSFPVGVMDTLSAPTGPLGVDTVVVTSDNWVLAHQRSPAVAKFPGDWAIGMGEGVMPTDEGPMRKVAVRSLVEELAMDAGKVDAMVRLVALAREETHGCWTGYAIADFRRCGEAFTAERILEKAKAAADAWESRHLQAIPRGEVRAFMTGKPCVPATPLLVSLLDRL